MTDTLTFIAGMDTAVEREIIESWTAAGLLRDSIWVDLDSADLRAGNLLELPVRQVSQTGTTPISVRAVYGEKTYSIVRVVALRPITADRKGDEPMDALWSFADQMKARLGARTVLRRVNLLVPDGTDVWTKQLLEPGCDINVIVSPEDRPGEGAFDHSLDRTDIFRAHAALACASVAGLWRYSELGAFDQPEGQGAGNHGRIVVTRAMARVVDGRSMPEEVVDRLMRDGVASLNQQRGPDPNRAVSDKAVIDAAVAAILPIEEDALSYRPPRLRLKPADEHLATKTLRMLVRFSMQLTKIQVLEWQQSGKMALAEAAELWLERSVAGPEDSAHRIVTADELREVAADAPELLKGILPGTVPVSTYLWSPLRQLSFSLVDGGDPPDEVKSVLNTLRPGVSDPLWVAPQPRSGLDIDPAERKFLRDLGLPQRRIRSADVNIAAALHERLPELPASDKHTAFRQRVKDWMAERKSDQSLVGRLAKHVSDQIIVAHNDLGRRKQEYSDARRKRNKVILELEQIRGKLSAHVWAMLVGLAGLLVWLVSLLAVSLPEWLEVLSLGIALAGLGYGTVVLSVLATQAAKLERALHRLDALLEAHVAAIENWPAEVDRLTSVYDVLVDWAEMIGWMLHEPYGQAVATPTSTAKVKRPEAFRVARPEVTADQLDEVIHQTTREVFGYGWLTHLYDLLRDTLLPDPDGTGDGLVDPDKSPGPGPNDTAEVPGKPPKHARERLLREFRDGNCGLIAKNELTGRIRENLLHRAPDRVMPMVSTGDGQPIMSTVEFLSAVLPDPIDDAPSQPLASTVFSDHGKVNGRANVARVYLWGPFEQLLRSSMKLPEHAKITRKGAQRKDLPYQLSVIRLDVSDGCEEADLCLLSPQDSSTTR